MFRLLLLLIAICKVTTFFSRSRFYQVKYRCHCKINTLEKEFFNIYVYFCMVSDITYLNICPTKKK